MIRISNKQERMLAFIEDFVAKNGYPPTYEEIKEGLDISTKSLVDYHLKVLENAAFIERIPNTPRGLRVMNEAQPTGQVPQNGTKNGSAESIDLDDNQIIELTYGVVTNSSNLYAFKVEGNNIAGDFAGSGDIVILQRQNQAQNGEVVAVKLLDYGETQLKRYYRENGHVRLATADSVGKSVVVAPHAVEIEGKVVAVIRQMDQTQA